MEKESNTEEPMTTNERLGGGVFGWLFTNDEW